MRLAIAAAAALFLVGATSAIAQTNEPNRPQNNPSEATPGPSSPSAQTAPPNATMPVPTKPAPTEEVGSRPIGPPSANDTAGKDDKNTTDLKKLEKQGRTGNN
jgi:hypothetical protein